MLTPFVSFLYLLLLVLVLIAYPAGRTNKTLWLGVRSTSKVLACITLVVMILDDVPLSEILGLLILLLVSIAMSSLLLKWGVSVRLKKG
jgi:hypothetical protein